ncbi:hypothetical protein CLV98_107199 [Dyadobacter jejuensis]|uniref:Uncharacterized protein n=1 Tax=Dyadobacter jejuensis TaxID=1082580 RepID=A0A316AIM0_9BACT|nr:hypothetical protein CLV98_107199 [Dyadobacter jejuensis]
MGIALKSKNPLQIHSTGGSYYILCQKINVPSHFRFRILTHEPEIYV